MNGKCNVGGGPILGSLALAWVASAVGGAYAQPPPPGVPPVRVQVRRVENPALVRSALQPLLKQRHRHTAAALLRVTAAESPSRDTTGPAGNFDVYRATQQQLLKSRLVLSTALKASKIAELAAVKTQADPVAWLARELRVDFPANSEIMQVSLGGDDPAETAQLVNAVADAYLNQVVQMQRSGSKETLDLLDRTYAEMSAELRAKRTDLQRLGKALGTGAGEVAAMKQQIALEELAEYRREALRTELELIRARILLTNKRQTLKKLHPDEGPDEDPDEDADGSPDARKTAELRRREAEVAELELEVEILSTQREVLQQHVAEKREHAERAFSQSVECEMMRAEIERMAEALDKITERREELRLDLAARPRVTLLQKATAAKPPE